MDWIKRMKEVMHDKGVNIEKLKTRIEQNGHSLSRNSIGNILNGRNSPKIETMQLIASALGVELWELFSAAHNPDEDNSINGFVEFNGHIHRIRTKSDFKNLYQKVELSPELEPDKPEPEEIEEEDNQSASLPLIPSPYVSRRGAVKKSDKLTRHVFKKYNVTVCSRREFMESSGELKRDVRIWAFRSNEDAREARLKLRKLLDFKFNG